MHVKVLHSKYRWPENVVRSIISKSVITRSCAQYQIWDLDHMIDIWLKCLTSLGFGSLYNPLSWFPCRFSLNSQIQIFIFTLFPLKVLERLLLSLNCHLYLQTERKLVQNLPQEKYHISSDALCQSWQQAVLLAISFPRDLLVKRFNSQNPLFSHLLLAPEL